LPAGGEPFAEFLVSSPKPPDASAAATSPKIGNSDTVLHIGQRIRQLRESCGMTQRQLQSQSRVSRSYLSRIESSEMTPSIGTFEKISEALNVGLNRFFSPGSVGENLVEDSFTRLCGPFFVS
jgi:ribosome-binding protein aMBF1 (putative translation factor)